LERLSVPRIAAYGFAAAAVIAAVQVPSDALHFLEAALTATLGSTLALLSWLFAIAVMAVLSVPVLWVARRLFVCSSRPSFTVQGAEFQGRESVGGGAKSLGFPNH
jgi:membrane protein implicated in regulation of membrane protease activity